MTYHSGRFQDFSLLVFKEKELVAILPANKVDEVLYSHQGLTYGGLILKESVKFSDVLTSFQELLIYLENEGVTEVILKSIPKIYHSLPSDELDYLMFKMNSELLRSDILSVVQPGEMKLSKDRKNGVKRGEKHNLQVKEVTDLDEFWKDILIPNLKEKYNVAPVHSLDEINLLKSKFPNEIRQFNVYEQDKIVGGTTVFETDQVAHSQYISGNKDKNSLGSLDFLHHYLLDQVFTDKPYFDFGISNENQGQQINKGLQYWKEGFGARAIVQNFYKIKTKDHVQLTNIML